MKALVNLLSYLLSYHTFYYIIYKRVEISIDKILPIKINYEELCERYLALKIGRYRYFD